MVCSESPQLDAKLLDGPENPYIHDSGNVWTRFRTVVRWDGAALTLNLTTLHGWWKDSSPDSVDSQPTQLEEIRILRFEASIR